MSAYDPQWAPTINSNDNSNDDDVSNDEVNNKQVLWTDAFGTGSSGSSIDVAFDASSDPGLNNYNNNNTNDNNDNKYDYE